MRAALLGLMLGVLLQTACGCSTGFIFNPQELYSLPQLPPKYDALNQCLSEIISGGAEYAAPTSGTNIQAVQMVDLDGDGQEEAVAFFRNAADEKPLKIYIFAAEGESYRQMAVIEGSGTAIYSIDYQDLNGDGEMALRGGWRVSTDLQALSVYALEDGEAVELVRSNYVKYAITDLDQDQKKELMVLRSDNQGEGVAEYYSWQDSGLLPSSMIRISITMAELSQQGRIVSGVLRDEVPALFITGVAENAEAITDILTVRDGELTNVVLSNMTGVSQVIAPFRSLYPSDMNNDGVTEVPQPVKMSGWGSGVTSDDGYRIDWYSYDSNGQGKIVMRTYHDMESGWYFQLPEEWTDLIQVHRSSGTDETVVTFSVQDGDTVQDILSISTLTGTNREIQASRGNRFNLSRQSDATYTAELLSGNSEWKYGLTEDQVREAFSLIRPEWLTGDN